MSAVFAHYGSRWAAVGRGVALCVIAVLGATQPAHGQVGQSLRVVPLVRGNQLLVTVELQDGFTPEVRAAIHSGLKTAFTYTVDLRLDVPGWIDRTIGTAVVTTTVEYDNFTRTHAFERRIDGRLQQTEQTADEAQVRRWMTDMQVALFPTSLLERNREYYVRVTATARPSQGSILWPFGTATSSQAKFTFLR